VVCGLLFLATTINYIDRQILALLKPLLDETFHWTNTQFGTVNAVFQAAYAVGYVAFGTLVDRLGVKLGYSLALGVWSVAAMLHALAGSALGFAWARLLLGLGEAGNFPSAVKAVAGWFPADERAFATTLFNSGSNVGAIIAPAVVPLLAFSWGWHAPFIAAGLAGLLWIVLWLPLYRRPPREDESTAPASIGWKDLLGRKAVWSYALARFLTDPVWWFFLIWLPDYFKKTRHLDLKASWVLLASVYGVVTVLSVFGGAVTSRLVARHGLIKGRKLALLTFALTVVPIVFVGQVGVWPAVVLMGIAGASHQAWSANLYTTVSDVFPQEAVARVVGLGGMAGSLGGILFPLLTGALLDAFEAQGRVSVGYGVLFSICGGAYVLAFVLNHALNPRFARQSFAPLVMRPR